MLYNVLLNAVLSMEDISLPIHLNAHIMGIPQQGAIPGNSIPVELLPPELLSADEE